MRGTRFLDTLEQASAVSAFITLPDLSNLSEPDLNYFQARIRAKVNQATPIPEHQRALYARVWDRILKKRLAFKPRNPAGPLVPQVWGWINGQVLFAAKDLGTEAMLAAPISVAMDPNLHHFVRDKGMTPQQAAEAAQVQALIQDLLTRTVSPLTPLMQQAVLARLGGETSAACAARIGRDVRSVENAYAAGAKRLQEQLELAGVISPGRGAFSPTWDGTCEPFDPDSGVRSSKRDHVSNADGEGEGDDVPSDQRAANRTLDTPRLPAAKGTKFDQSTAPTDPTSAGRVKEDGFLGTFGAGLLTVKQRTGRFSEPPTGGNSTKGNWWDRERRRHNVNVNSEEK